MATDDQKLMAKKLLRKVLKDLDTVSRLLDPQEVAIIQRLRSASREVKRADEQLR